MRISVFVVALIVSSFAWAKPTGVSGTFFAGKDKKEERFPEAYMKKHFNNRLRFTRNGRAAFFNDVVYWFEERKDKMMTGYKRWSGDGKLSHILGVINKPLKVKSGEPALEMLLMTVADERVVQYRCVPMSLLRKKK